MDVAHLLATAFVQEISTGLVEALLGYGLNLGAAVSVQRQKCTSIKIDIRDRSAVRGQKNRLLLEGPLNCVVIRAFRERCDRYQRPARKIRINEVDTMFGRCGCAAYCEPDCLGERRFSTASRSNDAG